MAGNRLARTLRVVAIVMLSITAVWTVLSGVGTSCVAFGAEKYGSMAAIVPYKGLYQAFVFLTAAVGLAAIVATVGFARGKRWAYPGALLILAVGLVIGGVHMYYSNMLRGSSAPANLRVYLSVLTIAVLLILRIPSIWKGLSFGGSGAGGSAATPGALAMIAGGLAAITTPLWATPTHVFDGQNWARVIDAPLMAIGGLLVAGGATLLASRLRMPAARRRAAAAAVSEAMGK